MAADSSVDLSATLQPNIYAGSIIPYIVAVGAVTLRFIARRLKKFNWWLDDWLILAALVWMPSSSRNNPLRSDLML